MTNLQGIDMARGPLQSSQILAWSDKERHTGPFPTIRPRLYPC